MDIEIQNLHSSWMRNMLQIISIGLLLIAYFKENKELENYLFLPITFIILGLIIGLYSIYYTYYFEIYNLHNLDEARKNSWKYVSILLCICLIYISIYIIKVL
jgi:uncharacterized membrane-anchored protein